MGAAEARALWQRRARTRCFVCHQHHQQQQQHSSSSSSSSSSRNTEKSSFFSSGDFSDDSNAKWWLKGSTNGGFDEEIFRNSMFQDTKCKNLQEFVDLTEQEEEEEEDYNGFGSKKAESMTPWWRTDKDQLALFVATKSFGGNINIQNCDLPPPMKLRCTSNGVIGKGFKAAVKSRNRFERSLNSSPLSSSPRSCELSKGEILEALRHSQTRAREAEEAAREALAEKERVIAILLRQAGQMLAYKHWLKLLEMEMMIKEEEEEEDMDIKGVNMKKRKKKKKIKKMGGEEIGRYVMAFALGFSLIGAGLFLGWTVGWFFTF